MAGALAIAAITPAFSQKARTPLKTADGKPDFSGVWWAPVITEPGKPEWLPSALKVAAERQANNRKDSPQVRCLPSAVLRRGPLVEFVQSKAVMIEMSDDDSPGFHHIFLSGHDHPKESDPLWYGDSVGHWEGATLVVETVGINPDAAHLAGTGLKFAAGGRVTRW